MIIIVLCAPAVVTALAAGLIFRDLCREVRHAPHHAMAEDRRSPAGRRVR